VEKMRGEFHKRVVTVLSIMILPILAVPFAIGRRRGHRAYRFALAVVLLVVYHEVLEQGALAVFLGKASPWIAIWMPFIALATFAIWHFYNACFTLKPARLEPTLDWLIDQIERAKVSVLRRFKAA
ncbi:MAG: LptF/LptG family permease, partial [Pseudomonadota bacterium]